MRVKELRQEIGVTQKKLAETSGLDLRWIQKIESGEISMDDIEIQIVKDYLNKNRKFLEE